MKQQQDHSQQDARNPLPRALVILTCRECERVIGRLDANTQAIGGEIARLRRQHAVEMHGWQPRKR